MRARFRSAMGVLMLVALVLIPAMAGGGPMTGAEQEFDLRRLPFEVRRAIEPTGEVLFDQLEPGLSPAFSAIQEWAVRDLNPRPPARHAGALAN